MCVIFGMYTICFLFTFKQLMHNPAPNSKMLYILKHHQHNYKIGEFSIYRDVFCFVFFPKTTPGVIYFLAPQSLTK